MGKIENMEKVENMEMFSRSPTEMFSGSLTDIFSGSPNLFTQFILTPRIHDSYSCSSSVTKKTGLTHYPRANTLSKG